MTPRPATVACVLAAILSVMSVGAADTKEKKTMKSNSKPGAGASIRMSLLPSPASPLVAFRVQFRCGAINDPPGKEGLNALTSMVIAQGGTRELTYQEVTERLYPMAATIDAQPDKEVTTYIGKAHRDHLKAYYDLLTIENRTLENDQDTVHGQ